MYGPRARDQFARDLGERRGLAGAVGTDQRVQFSGPDVEVQIVGCKHAPETLGQAADLKDVSARMIICWWHGRAPSGVAKGRLA